MTEKQNLKLFFDFIDGQMFGRSEMAAARVIDHDIEVTRFGERALECIVNRTRVVQVEPHWMDSWQWLETDKVARCSPNFVAASDE